MAHAYYVAGEGEEGIGKAEAFAESEFGIRGRGNPDLVLLRHNLFSVDDARRLMDVAVAAPVGDRKVVIVSMTRFFHEAQNALLKLFEEPPAGVTLVLVLPSEGVLLPTLRSRLSTLPVSAAKGSGEEQASGMSELAREFLAADDAEREKFVAKLVDRSKSDKDEEKQQARSDAVRLAEDLMRSADAARMIGKEGHDERQLRLFIDDLMHFLPLLHTRSAPLKLIYEHLRLVIPKDLSKTRV
ncbi:MAG: polymerase subunit delta [Candidatus Parcubacteria bacterium]|jgi:DNA polymerase III delta prime subunit|nr:polymerase subunit delta [Candidatus Parcubacteria bacterium]